MKKNFFDLFRESLKDLFGKPLIVLPSAILGLILFGISQLGLILAPRFQTTASNIAWTVFVGLASLFLASYVFSGMIGLAKKKVSWKEFSVNANGFWFRNFQILLLIVLFSFLIGRIAYYGAFFLGKTLDLEVGAALAVFLLIYFAGLIGILIFLTFSSFFLVVDKLRPRGAIRRSIGFVKRNYLMTLALNIILFVVGYLANKIPGLFGDAVIYVLVVPFFVLVLTKFVVRK